MNTVICAMTIIEKSEMPVVRHFQRGFADSFTEKIRNARTAFPKRFIEKLFVKKLSAKTAEFSEIYLI
jgi:hypothetical protein